MSGRYSCEHEKVGHELMETMIWAIIKNKVVKNVQWGDYFSRLRYYNRRIVDNFRLISPSSLLKQRRTNIRLTHHKINIRMVAPRLLLQWESFEKNMENKDIVVVIPLSFCFVYWKGFTTRGDFFLSDLDNGSLHLARHLEHCVS